MKDPLLAAFEDELLYLRRLFEPFAKKNPKVAARLHLTYEAIEDPHVSRLVDSVAFLNARIRRKLDDEFPEIAQALLSILDPHFLAPLPSLAIVQLEGLPDAAAAQRVPARTRIDSDPRHGESCSFETVYPVDLWPFTVELARLLHTPYTAPATAHANRSPAVIQLRLRAPNGGAPISALRPSSLRFYLHGKSEHVHSLYELLRMRVVEVALATSERDKRPAMLPRGAIAPVGFEPHEALLPCTSRSSHGQRLLSEVLAFPNKFLFLDLVGLPDWKVAECGTQLDLYLYLDEAATHLESAITPSVFALGCTPIVNLFKAPAAPIDLSPSRHEYRIVPDPRHAHAREVHSIESVRIAEPGGASRACFPLYSISHAQASHETRSWWHAVRRPAQETPDCLDAGTEVFLRFVDLAARGVQPGGSVATATCWLTNRDVPASLHDPTLALDGGAALKSLRCLTAITPTRRAELDGTLLWRAIAQLSLDHLSLVDGAQATQALREMLTHLDLQKTSQTRDLVEGVHAVTSERRVLRVVSDGLPGMVSGLCVAFELDERRYVGTSALLFASVLERFIGAQCGVNSFVQCVLKFIEPSREVHRWPARAGDRTIL